MVSFLLVLCVHGADDEDMETDPDFYLVKNFQMSVLPDVGHVVGLGGNTVDVKSVYHYLDDGITEVRCCCCQLVAACAYLRNMEGWKVQGGFQNQDDHDSEASFRQVLYKQSGRTDFEFIVEEDKSGR